LKVFIIVSFPVVIKSLIVFIIPFAISVAYPVTVVIVSVMKVQIELKVSAINCVPEVNIETIVSTILFVNVVMLSVIAVVLSAMKSHIAMKGAANISPTVPK